MTLEPHGILERDEEKLRLHELLAAIERGRGRTLAVEGPAGVGKSTLLAVLRLRAEAAGMRVMGARCAEAERTVAFGAARQLVEPLGPVVDWNGAELEIFDAVRRAVGDAAGHRPIVLTVDDVQWCDPESLRFLAHLSRRLEALPVALALAVRQGEPSAENAVLQGIVSEPQVDVLLPRPLSPAGLAQLISHELSETPDPRFIAACHDATRGNPFLASELLRELAAENVSPTATAAEHVRALGPRGVARSVLLQIGRLGDDAVRLARSVAVLGDGCLARHAARLAELPEADAQAAADALTRAGILARGTSLGFVHPIVRVAVHEDLAPGEVASAHLAAASMLVEDECDVDAIARHMALTQPRGDAQTVAILCSSARSSLARGMPGAAAELLERAIAEPPSPDLMVRVVRELGHARQLLGDPRASDTLKLAIEWTPDPVSRAAIAREVATSLAAQGDARAAISLLEHAAEAVRGRDAKLARCIQSELLSTALMEPCYLLEMRRRLAPAGDDAPADRLLTAARAVHALLGGAPAAEVARLARSALSDGELLREQAPDGVPFHLCVFALVQAEADDTAREMLQIALADAERRGSLVGQALTLAGRAGAEHASGRLWRAEADARAALDAGERAGLWRMVPSVAGVLASTLLDRQGAEAAWSVLERFNLTGALADHLFHCRLLEPRGRIRLAAGQAEQALADFEELGALSERLTIGPTRWRAGAALAYGALGEQATARLHAAAAVEEARAFGAAREMGVALRAQGLIVRGRDGIELLRQAVAVLEGSQGRLELARALIDLGSALRRAGDRLEGRGPLRRGQAIAHSAGAVALARRAADEIAATGARVSAAAASPDELTAAERRVAELATMGRSNKAIASELYLSLKTVEVHLTSVYRKLGIRSRRDLADALAERGSVSHAG